MEVSITQFRRSLFELVNQAMEGDEVWVTHKGRRFKIAPEDQPGRLSRITPLEVLDHKWRDPGKSSLLEEMERAWERDWSAL